MSAASSFMKRQHTHVESYTDAHTDAHTFKHLKYGCLTAISPMGELFAYFPTLQLSDHIKAPKEPMNKRR